MILRCIDNVKSIYINTNKIGTIHNGILNSYLEGLYLKLTPDTYIHKGVACKTGHLFISEILSGLNDPALIGADCRVEINTKDDSREIQIIGLDSGLVLKRKVLLPELNSQVLPNALEVRWLTIGKAPRYRMPVKFITENIELKKQSDNYLLENDYD